MVIPIKQPKLHCFSSRLSPNNPTVKMNNRTGIMMPDEFVKVKND